MFVRPLLITVPVSHYCEKARWALEWTRIPYEEKRHLLGFHLIPAYQAARSDTVPILVIREKTLTDSTDILAWADSKASSDRRLFPASAEEKREVLDLEDEFDEEFGVAGRLWMYSYMLDHLPVISKYSRSHGVPWHETKLLPILFPFMKSKIQSWIDLKPTSRVESRRQIDEFFERVAKRLADGRKFLVGDRFSAADLTFAALSAAVLIPEEYGVKLPRLDELPKEMSDQVRVWRAHPAGQFALRMYREFRVTPER